MSRKHPKNSNGQKKTTSTAAPDAVPGDGAAKRRPDSSPYVHQREKLDWNLSIRGRDDLTEKQKAIIELMQDKGTRILFLTGPAGTSKTWLAVYIGLLLLNQRRVSHITFVRTVVESASKSLGFLPGEASDKMGPYLMPLMDKLEEMLPAAEVKRLVSEERIRGVPVNYLRGASFNAQYIVVEESQNYSVSELVTAMTRIGKYSKMIVIGDPDQSDINGRSGLMPMYDLFNDESSREQGIFCLSLTREDIVRSGVLKYVAERLESYKRISGGAK